ncbi:MAG: glycosyltransferase family 4 protein [Chloroflexi bacterium]|nr:glycosyltransferase family 4 protein [Chloroflexota bacterium]
MKIAFVVPWYGPDVLGGAETMARWLVENLQRRGVDVEVLTTCGKDSGSNWYEDHYPEGESRVNGVPVRRFRVSRGDAETVESLRQKLQRKRPLSEDEELKFVSNIINSQALYDFIGTTERYGCYVFWPYWCGTSYWGAASRPGISYLIPSLHDEPTARLGVYRRMFENVRGVLFQTEEELHLAKRLYGLDEGKLALIGAGVNAVTGGSTASFRERHRVRSEFMLCVGRKADQKNTPLLLSYFGEYKRRNGGDLKLVLIGPGKADLPSSLSEHIVDLGALPECDKADAFAAATILVQPSVNESFSIVLMEGWLYGKPALVHSDCAVTAGHCVRSNGGLFFRTYAEFEGCVNFLVQRPDIRQTMGLGGRRYVQEHWSFDRMAERFLAALADRGTPADGERMGG